MATEPVFDEPPHDGTASDEFPFEQPQLAVTTTREEGCVVVTLGGELDIATGPLLDAALQAALQGAPAPTRLVLVLTALEFADVAGLGVVLRHERALARHGGTVELREPSAMVRRIVATLALGDRLHLGG